MSQANHRRWGLAATAATLMLAACGQSQLSGADCPPSPSPTATPAKPAPTATPAKVTTKPGAKASAKPTAAKRPATASPSPGSKTPKAEPTASPQDALDKLVAKVQAAKSYVAKFSSSDFRKDGQKRTISSGEMRFLAPVAHRLDIAQSTTGIMVGAKVVMNLGEAQASVKAGGILGLAVLKVDQGDERIASWNLWRLDEVVALGIVNRYAAGGYTVTHAGQASLGGETLTMLKLTHDANPLDPDIAYETVGIDASDMLRSWTCHARPDLGLKDNLLYQLTISQVDADATVDSGVFRL